jgi:hypothetical protein
MGAPSIDPAARQLIWRLVRDAAVHTFHPVCKIRKQSLSATFEPL